MVKNKIMVRRVMDYGIKLTQKEKLLGYLIEHKHPQSIRATSGAILADYKNTHTLVHELGPTIIFTQKAGNTSLIQLRLAPHPQIYMTEHKRTEIFLSRHQQLKIVKKYIEELNYPFLIVLVFGSYVTKTQTEQSDIDICIILDNETKSKELGQKLNLLPLKLEIHEFTSKDFISMIEKKQNNVGQEIVKNNIVLYGIENYYNLVSPWMKKE